MPHGAKDWFEKADIVHCYGGAPEPGWTFKAASFWAETFPPDQDVHVRHTYTPINGMFYISDAAYPGIDPADLCMTNAERAGMKKRIAGSEHRAALATQVRYVLTTGENWQGTIGGFKLIVDKEDPKNMVSLCVDFLTKTVPTRFERAYTDDILRSVLDALFIKVPE